MWSCREERLALTGVIGLVGTRCKRRRDGEGCGHHRPGAAAAFHTRRDGAACSAVPAIEVEFAGNVRVRIPASIPAGLAAAMAPWHLDHVAGEPVTIGIVAHHHRLVHYYLSTPAAKMDRAIASPNLQGEAMAPAARCFAGVDTLFGRGEWRCGLAATLLQGGCVYRGVGRPSLAAQG